MRIVVQRVIRARVLVEERVVGDIGPGLLVLAGVGREDTAADVRYIAGKIRDMRVFDGEDGRPNHRSVVDIGGAVLVVSQFTLYGDLHKGRRPSFDQAAPPDQARGLYEDLVRELRAAIATVATGEFQASMRVELVNDGPVTIVLDTRERRHDAAGVPQDSTSA
jgi:D-tyrosyl-tRNA(Tyr) deacylase